MTSRTYSGLGFLAGTLAMACVAAFLVVSLASAKTTVTQDAGDECKFKVTVEIAFAFLDDKAREKADEKMVEWVDAMSDTWNGPTGSQSFGDCDCQVTFEFKAVKLEKGKDCRQAPAGHHCINVVGTPTNQRGNVADAHEVPPDGSTNGFGEWSIGASANDAAHEIGHLMGLKDEYHYEDKDGNGSKETYVNDNVQKGADGKPKPTQSIMAQTWGSVAPTQEQIDEIMKDAGKSCPNTCCCGNKKVDSGAPVGEQCDYTADPDGCPEGQSCDKKCKCQGEKEPAQCGDGKVTPPEECDPEAPGIGCSADQECQGCKCVDKPKPPAPADTPAPLPPAPDNGDTPADEPAPEPPTEEPGPGSAPPGSAPQDLEPEPEAPPPSEPDPGPAAPPSGPACGDGACDPGEDCTSCPGDCGECPAPEPEPEPEPEAGPACGDGVCEGGEQCLSCPADCGECPVAKCEDGIDNDGDGLIDLEDPGCSWPSDDDETNAACGDGICQPETGENPYDCPADCPFDPTDL